MSEIVVRTDKLRKVYRSGLLRREFVGLAGLDLEVRRGEVFGYIGANGAGKTTTLKLLMGLNFPTSGTGEILGEPLGARGPRARIGFLPERPYFYSYLTAVEFLHFYGQLHGMDREARSKRIEELLPLVQVEQARNTQLRKFSKGMLQRVGLAQALINEPEFVVLDEPSSGLDPMGRMLIRDIIASLRDKGVTVLFSSHILSDVENICDRVAILAQGKLVQVGRPRDLVGDRLASVELTVEDLPSDAVAKLGAGTPILSGGRRQTFSLPNYEAANHAAREALASGAMIISMAPRRESLEQRFIEQVTHQGLEPVQIPEDGETS